MPAHPDPDARGGAPSAAALWAGWFLGPLAWALHETLSYGLVPWICADGHHWVFQAINGATLLLAVVGMLVARRNRRRAERDRARLGERGHARARFLATTGLLIAALSATAIVVESIPTYVLSACAN